MIWLGLVFAMDAAIYPVFVGEYLAVHLDIASFAGFRTGVSVVASVVVLLISVMQLLGTNVLVAAR